MEIYERKIKVPTTGMIDFMPEQIEDVRKWFLEPAE